MRIILTGGGTMGPVVPLLALVQELREDFKIKKQDLNLLWLGTKNGPEKNLIKDYQIPFKHIFHGKFRRYLSFKNLIDPFFIFLGLIQSFFILKKFKPDIILSVGGFVSVPVVWAGWLLKIPTLIHQQDIQPGLANKLMTPFIERITVTFQKSLEDFPKNKTVWTGNPVRKDILQGNKIRAIKFFNLEKDIPTLLIIGGGRGALELNKIVVEALPQLVKFCQVIHLTGKGKILPILNFDSLIARRYRSCEFLKKEIKDAFAIADLIITRAGLSTLTELCFLEKPIIIIPIPNSHQEENARIFEKLRGAVVLSQKNLTPQNLVLEIKGLLTDKRELEKLRRNIKKVMKSNAADNIIQEIYKIIG